MPRIKTNVIRRSLLVLLILCIVFLCHLYFRHDSSPEPGEKSRPDSINVIVINLDRRPDRLSWMQGQLEALNWPWMRLSATDSRDVDLQATVRRDVITAEAAREVNMPDAHKTFGITLTSGAVGCALSHLRAWDNAEKSDVPTLVMEDDVELRMAQEGVSSIQALLRRLEDVPSDWDIVYLGSGQYETETARTDAERRAETRGVRVVAHAYCLYGYVIRASSVKQMRAVLPLRSQIDGQLQELGLRKYILEPNLVVPRRDLISNIQIVD